MILALKVVLNSPCNLYEDQIGTNKYVMSCKLILKFAESMCFPIKMAGNIENNGINKISLAYRDLNEYVLSIRGQAPLKTVY